MRDKGSFSFSTKALPSGYLTFYAMVFDYNNQIVESCPATVVVGDMPRTVSLAGIEYEIYWQRVI